MLPEGQRKIINRDLNKYNALSILHERLVESYGPRCNLTHRCDLEYGTCRKYTGGVLYGFDQNGTCDCARVSGQPWFMGDECQLANTSDSHCYVNEQHGRLDDEMCSVLLKRLYVCGEVETRDGLPRACVARRLSGLECLQAGYLKGNWRHGSSSGGAAASGGSAGAAQDTRAAEALAPTLLGDMAARVRDRVHGGSGAGRGGGSTSAAGAPCFRRALTFGVSFGPLRSALARELKVKLPETC